MLLTYTTKGFKEVLDLMMKTVEPDIIIQGRIDGDYNSEEYKQICFNKARAILHILELHEGETLMYIDNDVLLFEKPEYFINQLGDHDFIAQQEPNGTACCGFMVMKNNETVKDVWRTTIDMGGANDQIAFNKVPKDIIFFEDVKGYGNISGGKIYNGEDFEVPKCSAFHANYAIGKEDKLKIMKKVYETINPNS